MRLYQIVFDKEELPIFLGGDMPEVLRTALGFLWALGKIETPQDTSSLCGKLNFRIIELEERGIETELVGAMS